MYEQPIDSLHDLVDAHRQRGMVLLQHEGNSFDHLIMVSRRSDGVLERPIRQLTAVQTCIRTLKGDKPRLYNTQEPYRYRDKILVTIKNVLTPQQIYIHAEIVLSQWHCGNCGYHWSFGVEWLDNEEWWRNGTTDHPRGRWELQAQGIGCVLLPIRL